jgi:D-arabinose 1-dehydrogenase-like Zn-dependent alcohol dehydrogenase
MTAAGSNTMKALIKAAEQPGALELADMPLPEPAPGHVLVQVKAASLCYSDVSILNNKYIGRKPVPIPLILGHEGSGVVAARGAGVTQRAVGERVALEPITGCGHCAMCRKGFKTLCADWIHIGIT